MSEWNLSVRLTGQGSSLARTLRDTSRDARRASRDVNALRRDIDRLRDSARNNIRIRVRLDAGDLRRDVRNALNTAGAGQGLAVNLRLGDPMQLRRDVADAVRWASMGHRITIPIGLDDPMQLRRDVSAAVRWASMNQTITVRVTPDTSALRGLGGTRPGGGGGGGGGGGNSNLALQGLLMLAPAAIPLTAGLTALLGPLTASLFAAGGAATAFGIAIAGQVERLGEVADAEKKYQDAVREHGKSSQQAIEAQVAYQQQLAQLPPEAQKAAIALSQLKQTFGDWSDDMTRFTMEPVTKGITVLDQLIPRLSPEVASFSGTLDRLLNVAGGAISTPGFDTFADKVAHLTDQKLDEFTDQVIHLMRTVSEGDVGGGALGQLLDYARENGPEARAAIQAMGQAVMVLAEGASNAGPTMLTLVTAASRLVAALPPELVAVIIQVATALKLVQLAGAGMAVTAAAAGRLRAQIAALAATSAGAGGGIAGLRAAILSLGTAAKASLIIAGIGLAAVAIGKLMDLGREAPPDVDKLTTSLGKLGQSGKATGELSRGFGKDLDDLYEKVRNITDPSTLDNIQNGLVKVFSLGMADSTPSKEARAWLDSIDEGLTNLVRGGKADQAAAAYEKLKAAYGKGGKDVGEFTGQMDKYKAALADVKFEQELAAASMGLFGKAAIDTQNKLDAQKKSADGLRQSIQALNDVNRAGAGAMNAFEAAIDDAAESAKTNAGALKMHNGELDLNGEKARDAESKLRDLASATDDAAAKAREQGKSWDYVQGIMTRGQQTFIDTAQKMGLTKAQAQALAQSYLDIPDSRTTVIEMRTEDAIAGLDAVVSAINKTPNAKSVTVKALTTDAISMLEAIGFTVKRLPNGQFKVTADTATAKAHLGEVKSARDALKNKTLTVEAVNEPAIRDLAAVQEKVRQTKGKTITMKAPTAAARSELEKLGFKIRDTKGKNVVITVPTGTPKSQVSAIQSAINSLHGKTVTNYVNSIVTTTKKSVHEAVGKADGGVVDFYADGGIRSTQRGGLRSFAGGAENHVAQVAPAGSWRMWAEPETGGEAYIPLSPNKRIRSRAIAEETVRRLGGDPQAIQWNADGNVTDWRYDPETGSLYSASDAGAAGHKTKKVKVKVKGKWKTKEVEYFDIGAVEKKLKSAAKATTAWNKDLEKVADRVGGDVAQALAAMGEDGMKLAHKMATGSTKYINDMAKALKDLQKTAKASLTDYTRQLTNANTVNKKFSDDLAKLAGMGYGDLASQLAAQNDEAAQQLAAAAVKDPKKAAAANAQAKKANSALTADEVGELVQIIAAIKTKSTGIHDVAGTTGLGEDEIIDVGNKAKAQIHKALGGRAARFMSDLMKANKHLAYADGGIRAGMYATQGGIVRFAEPETGGEAYLPLGPNKRRSAMPVLADVARRFGVGLTDVSAARPVVIVRGEGDMHVNVTAVRSGATASDIAAQVGRSVRRARRGGVAARAA